jgi:hypothetical protein
VELLQSYLTLFEHRCVHSQNSQINNSTNGLSSCSLMSCQTKEFFPSQLYLKITSGRLLKSVALEKKKDFIQGQQKAVTARRVLGVIVYHTREQGGGDSELAM